MTSKSSRGSSLPENENPIKEAVASALAACSYERVVDVCGVFCM